jgi:hypothetical protein
MPSCDVNTLPHCCGFYEAGEFRDGPSLSRHKAANNHKELLDMILDHAEGRPVIFNFVKEAIRDEDDYGEGEPTGDYQDDYECDGLRQVVINHPKVIDIGTHINPGTHNMIHSLIIKGYKDE